MKNKMVTIAAIAVTIMLMNIRLSTAENDWQVNIKAKILDVENRLVIGQGHEAGDGIDGRYDVPALLGGDIEAYIELEDNRFWKDIKKSCENTCQKMWNIFVESNAMGNMELTWDLLNIPNDISINLLDTKTGEIINMKTNNKYPFENTGKRRLIVEVQKQ